MRPYLVPAILVVLILSLVFHFILRPIPELTVAVSAPGPSVADGGPGDGQAEASAPEPEARPPELDGGGAPGRGEAGAEAGLEVAAVQERRLLSRPLRVLAAGWELVAPGALANGGLEPSAEGENVFLAAGLEVQLAVSSEPLEIERALAAGGEQEGGADVAILALSSFAASYPDLAPLEPRVFLVTGFSVGHHALMARSPALVASPPTDGEVAVVTQACSPAHFLALFALELLGVEPARVQILTPGQEGVTEASLRALQLPARAAELHDGRWVTLLSTTQAPRLIAYVAVASGALLESEREALEQLSLIWIDAAARVAADVPEAARRLGALAGAPSPLELLGPLSRVGPASVEDNASFAGLSGRSAATAAELFAQASRLWREAGVVSVPPPPSAPVAVDLLASTIRSSLARRPAGRPVVEEPLTLVEELEPLLALRLSGTSEPGLVARLGLIAEVFSPLPLRARGGVPAAARLDSLLERARDRYGLSTDRVRPAVTTPTSEAVVEVLAPR